VGKVITLIVPTRNRAHTLRLVASSYFQQEAVTEIIFVNDAGTDDTPELVQRLATGFPQVRARCLSNASRVGASQSRNLGVSQATNDYILFCDDDEYLEPGYAKTCLRKLLNFNAGAVSGRRIYLDTGESQQAALRRFGHGMRRTSPFRSLICEYVNAARFDGDLVLPITNAIILTRKALLEKFPFDAHYARGNGYREESDFQMNLFVNNYSVYVTNECHSFHLPNSLVRSGGQRMPKLGRLYWSIQYTRYFFGKYYAAYASKLGLRSPRSVALWAFTIFAIYRETLRPPFHAVAKWMLKLRQRMAVVEMPT
jgi:glycosyltransferase involved in cell wall biosynthesis